MDLFGTPAFIAVREFDRAMWLVFARPSVARAFPSLNRFFIAVTDDFGNLVEVAEA